MSEIVYRIDRPYLAGIIEVYTVEAGVASYEWRVVERGEVIHDSANQGYGSPGVALRDALIWDTD